MFCYTTNMYTHCSCVHRDQLTTNYKLPSAASAGKLHRVMLRPAALSTITH